MGGSGGGVEDPEYEFTRTHESIVSEFNISWFYCLHTGGLSYNLQLLCQHQHLPGAYVSVLGQIDTSGKKILLSPHPQ